MINPAFFKFLFGFLLIVAVSFGVIFAVGFLDERDRIKGEAAALEVFQE